jgi:hypothetical protein
VVTQQWRRAGGTAQFAATNGGHPLLLIRSAARALPPA